MPQWRRLVTTALVGLFAVSLIGIAKADPHQWQPVGADRSKIRFEHESLKDARHTHKTRQTENYSANVHFVLIRPADEASRALRIGGRQHLIAMAIYRQLLPGYRFGAEQEPGSLLRSLFGDQDADLKFDRSFGAISKSRRFSVRLASITGSKCFVFIRYWGDGPHELAGPGNRLLHGFVCDADVAEFSKDLVVAYLDGLSTVE